MNKKQAEHDRTVLPGFTRCWPRAGVGGRSRAAATGWRPHGAAGRKWTHIAVGRILARAERTPPQEASPPAAQAELPPPPTEQAAAPAEPPPPTEPPPAPAPPFQKIEEQFEKAADQLSARIQEREEHSGPPWTS